MMSLKQTPLYQMHLKYNGKIIDFGGWELPVQYEGMGVIKEHNMVREQAGLFDVSHMGEVFISGEKAEEYVQNLVCNNIKTMQDLQVLYALMCYPGGGVVDDLLVYRYHRQKYLLVINAANVEKDFAWMQENLMDGMTAENVSAEYAQLALQGPKAQEILQKISDTDLNSIKFFWFNPAVKIAGVECIVSRTGYTGEDGFEIYVKPADAAYIWEEILSAGGDLVSPVGLGARDSLRFESKLPLYGQEIDQDITPLEGGLGFFVKLDNDDFIGRDALLKQKEAGLKRKQVEFSMLGKGIARSHYDVCKDGVCIGHVTTGLHAPTFKKPIGLALIDIEHSAPGTEIDIMIRDKAVKAVVGQGIFYKKKTKAK
ncbi:MAG: glycine cleavage system aminomethyltransferase GcvT [Syntrophomonadaceae bacterium]|nr:glycine cleavage system aminomethyltransferase GcvT [Syntrophomonadaceae bacterium]MDD3023667.1 glycine cleavage system aminomethyltransferase GcvT [Syntrophomonadaceae bacterium]